MEGMEELMLGEFDGLIAPLGEGPPETEDGVLLQAVVPPELGGVEEYFTHQIKMSLISTHVPGVRGRVQVPSIRELPKCE